MTGGVRESGVYKRCSIDQSGDSSTGATPLEYVNEGSIEVILSAIYFKVLTLI